MRGGLDSWRWLRPADQGICVRLRASTIVVLRDGRRSRTWHADVAQLVAHHLAKVRVAGSNPVIRSKVRMASTQRWSGRVVRQRPAKPCTRVRFPSPPPRSTPARLAQRESASLTRKRSLVQSQYRAPGSLQVRGSFCASAQGACPIRSAARFAIAIPRSRTTTTTPDDSTTLVHCDNCGRHGWHTTDRCPPPDIPTCDLPLPAGAQTRVAVRDVLAGVSCGSACHLGCRRWCGAVSARHRVRPGRRRVRRGRRRCRARRRGCPGTR